MYLYKYGGAYRDFFTIAMLGTCTSVWRGQRRLPTIVISGICTSMEGLTKTFYNCYVRYLYKFVEGPTDFQQLLSQVYVQVWRGLPRLFTIAISGTCTSVWRGQQTSNNCYLRYMYKHGGAYPNFLRLLFQVPVHVSISSSILP